MRSRERSGRRPGNEASAWPHRFFTTSKSRKVLVATHLNIVASNLGHHFLYLYLHIRAYTCALKDHTKLLLKIAELDGWDRKSRVCFVLSIESGILKDWGRSPSLIWIDLNDWVKYYPCFLNAWIYGYPRSLDRESWLCHPSREGLTQCLKGC